MPLKGLKEKLNYITCSILLIQPSQRILQIWWKYSQLSNFVRCCNRQIFNVINTAKSILYLHYHLGQFGASYFQMPIHFFLAFLFICSVTSNLIFELSSILSIATVISLLLLWFFYLFVFVPPPPRWLCVPSTPCDFPDWSKRESEKNKLSLRKQTSSDLRWPSNMFF